MDFDNMKVRIDTEKTKKERTLFWSEETRKTLCKMLPIRWEIKRSNALFIGTYNSGEYSNRLSTRAMERWFRLIRMRAGMKRKLVLHGYQTPSIC